MDSSDDEYVDDFEPTEAPRRRNLRNNKVKSNGTTGYSWEDEYYRSWDVVQEDSAGSLAGAVAGMVETTKRKRILHDTRPVQRGIIRNLVLIVDLSFAMADNDMRPTRLQRTITIMGDFIQEYFGQNPISQLAIVGMADGLAHLVSPLDGNPHLHLANLQKLKKGEPSGIPSLQNALEMARAVLYHVPRHCTKEVLVVFGALMSNDPKDIEKTIKTLCEERVRVRIIGLAAQVAVCQRICEATNFGDKKAYQVVLNEQHFRELMLSVTVPLSISAQTAKKASTLVLMGFPSRVTSAEGSLCACHGRLTKHGYVCPRCKAKICTLPMLCPYCSLTLILSTHLARSYHHLFPLNNFEQIDADESKSCYACLSPFQEHSYQCPDCKELFCVDCDVFCHESLHNCPGCESKVTTS